MRILSAVLPASRQPVELREFDAPEIAPGGAVLRTMYSEVCGSNVHLWPAPLAGVAYPIIPGHAALADAEAMRLPKAFPDPHHR